MKPQVIAMGFPGSYVPTPDDPHYLFDSTYPYCGCLLCGEVFQSALDRSVPSGHLPHNSLIARLAYVRRKRWREGHRCGSSPAAIRPGGFASPVAAQKLARLGVFSLIDICVDDEVIEAVKEA